MGNRFENIEKHYDVHLFCCVNERPSDHPRGSCTARGAVDLQAYMKDRCKELALAKLRVNKAGCLNRCELGPALVIYPEGVWYTVNSRADVDEVIEKHVMGGELVERILLQAGQTEPAGDGAEESGGAEKAATDVRVRVQHIEALASDIKMFEMVAEDGGELPVFEAGAHVDVMTGNGLRRSYSLANDPAERNRYVTAILREANGGGGSAWMHDEVKEGDLLTLKPPINNFPLDPTASEHILIAGGIGITPIIAMGHELQRRGANGTLHYCTKSPEETAFLTEVEEVFGKGRVVFHHDGGDPSQGIKLDEVLGERPNGAHLYLCGPAGLIDAARAAAGHWPQSSIHFELFASAKTDAADAASESFEVELKESAKTVQVPADKSILEAVTEAGVEADSACQQGLCGSCEVKLLGGEADHRDQLMNDEQKAANDKIYICVSRAKSGAKLILDI